MHCKHLFVFIAQDDFMEWTEWSECSKTCDGGVKGRGRSCKHGGPDCVEGQTAACNEAPCASKMP